MKDVVIVLPSIRSAHNTGAFFRTADAAGVSKIILTGYTAPPPHPKLIKVSLGAEESVPWEKIEDTDKALALLDAEGYQIVAVEFTESSEDFRMIEYADKVALVFGNEIHGVSEKILHKVDAIAHIPMRGTKESLNVSVTGGIMMYHVLG